MGLIDRASGASLWRGYDYYTGKKVLLCKRIDDHVYAGKVSGNGADYDVEINLEKPYSSKCNCPHANGRRIVCKHMVAMYFTAFPKEAERFYEEAVCAMEEEEERQERLEKALEKCITKMGKAKLQDALWQLLVDGPEWQYERFLRDYVPEYWE